MRSTSTRRLRTTNSRMKCRFYRTHWKMLKAKSGDYRILVVLILQMKTGKSSLRLESTAMIHSRETTNSNRREPQVMEAHKFQEKTRSLRRECRSWKKSASL